MDDLNNKKQLEFLWEIIQRNTRDGDKDRELAAKFLKEISNFKLDIKKTNEEYNNLRDEYFKVIEMLSPKKLIELQKMRFK